MKKIFLSIFLSFVIILYSIPSAAYASMATASNAQLNIDEEWIGDDGEFVATSSDADLIELDDQIDDLAVFANISMLMSSDDDVITEYPNFSVYARIVDSSRVVQGYVIGTRSSGSTVYKFPTRTDDLYYDAMFVRVKGSNLPDPGTYGFRTCFRDANISLPVPSGCWCTVFSSQQNVLTDDVSGDATYEYGINPSNNEQLVILHANVELGYKSSQVDLGYTFQGLFQALDVKMTDTSTFFQTTLFNGDALEPVVSSDLINGSGTAAGVTANSAVQIADNTASMADSMKEIVQTISNQLAALWDQMYNLMHVPQLANDDKNTNLIIQNEQQNTEQVTGAIEQHGNFIIEGLKSLFIPSDDYFKSYFDDLYEWFSDRFGFLSFPIDLLVKFSDLILSSGDVDCILTLPSFDIMGEQLLYEQTFNLTDFLEENFMVVLTALRMGSSVLLIMAFVNLCGDKWDEVMKN